MCAIYTAVPTFKLDADRPHDKNVNVGEDVVFHCNAYAIPEASVVWYKNGTKIDRKSLFLDANSVVISAFLQAARHC